MALKDKTQVLRLKDGFILHLKYDPLLDHERPKRSLVIKDAEMGDVILALSTACLDAEEAKSKPEDR
jgi:hypothetical protein